MTKNRRVSSTGAALVAALLLGLFAAAPAGCSHSIRLGEDIPLEGGAPSFAGPVDEAGILEAGLTSYCPSNKCPPGWTTCPDSRFPCDTNVRADSRNCGACGNTCPTSTGYEQFTCSEGACKMECGASFHHKDCDGLIENGCESPPRDPKNCGACGVVCDDCTYQDPFSQDVACGCPPGMVDCGVCTDSETNDGNCGACDNVCDKTGGPGAPQYPNVYYGCLASECGKLKCNPRFADCDQELENGCETSTDSDENCGACGNKCGAGQRCAVDPFGRPSCVCAKGLTFCGSGERYGLPEGLCQDLSNDAFNCGACGKGCYPPSFLTLRERALCDFGKCVLACVDGAADCNGAQSDGCEIDTKSDPRNCGGCGITCDLILGQACVAGRCVVEPCDQADAGEVTR